MKQYRYEDLKDIAYAVAIADEDGYPPSVMVAQNIVIPIELENNTFNLGRHVEMIMDGPEDPYIEIFDSTGAIEWEGYIFSLEEKKWKAPYMKMFDPDFRWFLTNESQVRASFEDFDEEAKEAVEDALRILQEEGT